MALIWVLGGTEMLFWNFDKSDLSPGWRWVEIIETWRDINVSHPSRSQLISMQVSIYASHLHPGHVSPSCGSRKLHLVSIQVQSETHPGIIMCLTSIHVLPHLHPCPPSMHRFTSIHVPKFFNSCCSQVMMLASTIHPFHVSHPSRSRELLLSSILVPPLHIQVSRCVSQPNPGATALPRLNICTPSPPRTRLTQFRKHFTSIYITIIVYHLHPIEVSLQSRSCLTWIQVPRYLCNLHPCSNSPPSSVQICI